MTRKILRPGKAPEIIASEARRAAAHAASVEPFIDEEGNLIQLPGETKSEAILRSLRGSTEIYKKEIQNPLTAFFVGSRGTS